MAVRLGIGISLLLLGLVGIAEAAPSSQSSSRTLEDIHIEGEIPVPQVLFVSGRDQRRFMDFQHKRYLKTSLEIGRTTVYPTRITVVGVRPLYVPSSTQNEARKEQQP